MTAIDERSPTSAAETIPETPPCMSLRQLARVFLWLGTISVGGRSASYIQNEFVHRRSCVSIEDYLEYFTLARILPGSTGQSVAVLTAQRLRGSAGALACLVPYVLPGGLLALFLAALIFGVERPAWLEGALHGFSIGGLAFVLATTFRTARAVRLSRAGLLVVAATSLAYGPLGLSLVPVLLGFGVLSLILHRPRPTGAASGAGVAVPAGAGGETEKSHA